MKKLLLPLLLFLPVHAIGPVDFYVALPNGLTSVLPSTPTQFNLIVRGCDSVSATVNGTSVGTLMPPYTINFTSSPSGVNTIVVVMCGDRGQKTTNTLTIPTQSTVRVFAKKIYR